MTDINLQPDETTGLPDGSRLGDEQLLELIELLFFAYRDFVSDPDEILETYGFGRAHHRVLHFVARNPGIRVAALLDILRITKQSLGRVLRQLIEEDFVYQREGREDRRERRLYLTERGIALARDLASPQLERVARALEGADPASRAVYREILLEMIDAPNRDKVKALIARARQGHKDGQAR